MGDRRRRLGSFKNILTWNRGFNRLYWNGLIADLLATKDCSQYFLLPGLYFSFQAMLQYPSPWPIERRHFPLMWIFQGDGVGKAQGGRSPIRPRGRRKITVPTFLSLSSLPLPHFFASLTSYVLTHSCPPPQHSSQLREIRGTPSCKSPPSTHTDTQQ